MLSILSMVSPLAKFKKPVNGPITISNRLAFYNFEGNNANDSWNSYHGTKYGSSITSVIAKNGTYSMTSDGTAASSSYIQLPSIPYTASNGLSFSFWFYSGNAAVDMALFQFISDSITCSIYSHNAWRFGYNAGWSPSLALNTWYNATITIASNGAFTAYHNGVAFASFTITALNGTLPSGRIGRPLAANAASLNGNIDDFRIYNKVLTQDEVTGLYNNNNTYI